MLRLLSLILAHILSSPAASPIPFPLHRLISAAAPAVSSNPSFAVEDYLVRTCGLTRDQVLKASTKLSHLRSPTKPDAVIAFLAGLDLSSAQVAAVVAKDPRLLCAKVGKTLAPVVVGLTGHGLSHTEIARLVSLVPASIRHRSIVSNLPYYLSLFGSCENLLRALKRCDDNFFSADLERVVKPNVALLRECGLDACDIAKLCIIVPRALNSRPERLQAMVACAEGLGVPRGSQMFRAPLLLTRSKESMQHRSEFLINEVGLEPAYIAHRPVMLMYSLEGRIRPRYYVFKFLMEKGLLHQDRDYYNVLNITEKVFMEKFICPHKEPAPHLAEDYAAACRGEMPTRFRFT
ncbi:unnamed protein product [Alopecurus aequalis]